MKVFLYSKIGSLLADFFKMLVFWSTKIDSEGKAIWPLKFEMD